MEAAFGLLNRIFTLEKTISFLTRGKSAFDLPSHSITLGSEANLTLFDPSKQYKLVSEHLISTSKNCMHLGQEMQGKVLGCLIENQFVES